MVSNMMGEPVPTLTYAMATNREGETLLESMVRPLKWVKRAERNVHRHDVAAKVKNPAPDPPQTMRQNLDQDRGYNRLAFSPALILAVPTAFPSSITQCACLCVCVRIEIVFPRTHIALLLPLAFPIQIRFS